METTGNYTAWDGNIDNLPDDTSVTVTLGDIRKHNKRIDKKIDATYELMSMIGKTGKHVYVRYDPLRDYSKNYFTVIIDDPDLPEGNPDKTWRMDTDNPIKALYLYIEQQVED